MERTAVQEKRGKATDDELEDNRQLGMCQPVGGDAGDAGNQEIREVILLLGPPGEPQDFAGEVGIEGDSHVAVDGAGPADGFHADGGSIEEHGDGDGLLDDFQAQE